MKTLISAAIMGLGVALTAPALAAEQSGNRGDIPPVSNYWGDSGFTIQNFEEYEVVSYSSERDVRVCVGDNATGYRDEPVWVRYDGNEASIFPGFCREFEAKRVVVSARDNPSLPEDWEIEGRVSTR